MHFTQKVAVSRCYFFILEHHFKYILSILNLQGKRLPKIYWFQNWISLFEKYKVNFTGELQNIEDWPELTNKLLIKIKSTFRADWEKRAKSGISPYLCKINLFYTKKLNKFYWGNF